MKKDKFLMVFILFVFCSYSWSQIVITEIHFDTPFEERNELQHNFNHHSGEYIELYNFSNRDISLKGWSLTDYIGKFVFPDDAVINSGAFLIIAYRDSRINSNNLSNPNLPFDYFSTIFPNTTGQENKIIYQDKIILKNLGETLRLHIGYVGATNCNNFKIQEVEFGIEPQNLFYSELATNDPQNFDFYSFSTSIHLDNNGTSFYTSTPTPLYSDYVPPIQNFESIPSVLEAMFINYNILTWEDNSNAILSNVCSLVITEVEQTSSETYLDTGKCFTYDASGNTTLISNCLPSDINNPNPITEYTPEEIADIESKLILYPNPTNSNITASWDTSINEKITEVQITSTSGVNVLVQAVNASQSSIVLNITFHPPGIYIVKFVLNTGQFISKNIIKI